MKTIETPTSIIQILSDNIVLSRPKHGVEVDYEATRLGVGRISEAMPGEYGIIIERAEDYSIVPTQVYEVLNTNSKIKAIAIVVHNKTSEQTAQLNKMFFDKELEIFFSVGQAYAWIEKALKQ